MKRYKIYCCIYSLLAMIAICSLQSCEDDNYDVEGNPDNLFYFRNNWSPADKPQNSYIFNIVRTPVGEDGDDVLVKLPVRATQPVGSNVTVSIAVDNALVDEYNAQYGTDYKTFPEGSVNLVKSSVTFSAGVYESADSLHLIVPRDQYKNFTESAYLLPVRLTDATKGKTSSTNGVIWVFMNSTFKLIKDNAGVDDMLGKVLEDRSGWTISSADEPSLNYATCLDGNQNTGVNFANVQTPVIVIDMQKINKVTGLRIIPYVYSWGDYYDLSSVNVELSSDNSTWTAVGTATSMGKNGNYQLIAFYEARDARYIRLTLAWKNGGGSWGYYYRYLNEVEAYVME